MRKRKLNFNELLSDNKKEINADLKALEKIEVKIDNKLVNNPSNKIN